MRSLPEGRCTNQHLGGALGWDNGPLNISVGFGNTRDTADDDQIRLKTIGGVHEFAWAKLSALYHWPLQGSQAGHAGPVQRSLANGDSNPLMCVPISFG